MDQEGLHRQQALYWAKMVELRVAANYIRGYRNYLGRWTTGIGTVRAVASSLSIGGWAIWHQYAFVWAAVIASAQVLDAIREVFPVTRRKKAAGELAIVLEGLFIDAQLEWENVFAGKYTDEQISKRLHTLRTQHHMAEGRLFHEGLSVRDWILRKSELDAELFFQSTYGVSSLQRGGNDARDTPKARLD